MKCDAGAFAGMYETVYKDLYRFALCMMRNPHDAEDAVSDAVVNAFTHIASLRDEAAFKSWIFTILANTCKRRLKESAKQQTFWEYQETQKDGLDKEEPDYGFSLDVRKAFAVLSEEEQLVVGLSVFGGYTSSEIGKTLHMNDNTVRSKRKRALEKMSIVLE